MKAWKGKITFGFVEIPIELYAAIQEHVQSFTLLHATCHTPLEYKRWCPKCAKEVVWENVVKGLKQGNKYVILTKEVLQKYKPESSDILTILEFVAHESIEPIYYDRHYYALPSGSYKAYTVLTQALAATSKIAIGHFVMHEKEHICAIQPYENGLLLSILNYTYEIRPLKKIQTKEDREKTSHISTQELALAEQFIKHLTHKTFVFSKYRDKFAEKLRKKLKQKTSEAPKRKPRTVAPQKSTLIESLRANVHVKKGQKPTHGAVYARGKRAQT